MEGSDGVLIGEVFEAYERLRRARVQAACKESMAVVSSVKETSRFGFWLKTCIIPVFLRLGRAKRQKHFEEDITRSDLGIGEGSTAVDAVGKTGPETGMVVSLLSRLQDAWRRGGLLRFLRVVIGSRS